MSKLHIRPVAGRPEFLDATKEELRVLIAISEQGSAEPERIAELCGISKARASSAISYWRESGIITEGEGSITDEFEDRLGADEIEEESSATVAASIRDNSLADMITECAVIMKRASLNSQEVKKLAALYTQYSLSEEYIITLAAYLAEKLEKSDKRLTVTKLVTKALSLHEKSIETTEALEDYIKRDKEESYLEREFRRLFGIYGRTLTKTEKDYFKKWSEEYGYFVNIVGEAYDICVNSTSKLSLAYIDKILKGWYDAGCRTLAECRAKHEQDHAEKAKKPAKPKKQPEETTLKYGDFDVNEAFQRALARSYGSIDENNN